MRMKVKKRTKTASRPGAIRSSAVRCSIRLNPTSDITMSGPTMSRPIERRSRSIWRTIRSVIANTRSIDISRRTS